MFQETPRLGGQVHVSADPDQLYDELGHSLLASAQLAVRKRGTFHLALSGGSSPEGFYIRLAVDPQFRSFPWSRTHVWMVDERRVPESDEHSNYRMIREALLDHVVMPQSQRHPMPVMDEQVAREYEHELCEVFHQRQQIPRLDFVLLGMGADCHTASLFPHTRALRERDALICVNDGRNVTPPPRVTMTYPLLNAARHVAVMVTGEAKAAAITRIDHQLSTSGPDPVEMPITGVSPIDGAVAWHLDKAAAGTT